MALNRSFPQWLVTCQSRGGQRHKLPREAGGDGIKAFGMHAMGRLPQESRHVRKFGTDCLKRVNRESSNAALRYR